MATIKEQNTQNLATAQTLQSQLKAQLAAASLDSDLISVIVPVGFAVVVQANPGSALTIEQIRTLASDNNMTLYEP